MKNERSETSVFVSRRTLPAAAAAAAPCPVPPPSRPSRPTFTYRALPAVNSPTLSWLTDSKVRVRTHAGKPSINYAVRLAVPYGLRNRNALHCCHRTYHLVGGSNRCCSIPHRVCCSFYKKIDSDQLVLAGTYPSAARRDDAIVIIIIVATVPPHNSITLHVV